MGATGTGGRPGASGAPFLRGGSANPPRRNAARSRRVRTPAAQDDAPAARAAVLLEVVLALALFAATSAIVLGSLNACLRAARGIRQEAAAADLAVTLLSEIQMGLVPLRDAGPEAYEKPLDAWTWQVVTTAYTDRSGEAGLRRVEIIVTYAPRAYVHRLVALVPDEAQAAPALALKPAAGRGGGP